MNPLQLIIEREYVTRVKKKSFIFLTLFMPFLFVAIALVPALLASIKDSTEKKVVVIDNTGMYAPELISDEQYVFVQSDANTSADTYKQQLGNDIFAILSVTANLSENPKSVSLLSEKQPPMELITHIETALSEKVKEQKLDRLAHTDGVDTQAIAQVQRIIDDKTSKISLSTLRREKSGEVKESSTLVASIVGGIFTFMIYMFIMIYGGMVMQAVMEEKKNRIVEVMVSSVRPVNLLVGKILGIGLVGITQLLIWGVMVGALLGGASFFMALPQASSPMGADPAMMNEWNAGASQLFTILRSFNWVEIIFLFFIYFIGGYMMYASLFATIGSAVDNDQDTQQFMMPITIIILFAFYAGFYSIKNPDGPLAFWCSLIPFTSPIVMMVRLPFGVPLWEKLLSVALLFGTFVLIARFAAKIYRVGILMYGKKPTVKEMIKWMKYK